MQPTLTHIAMHVSDLEDCLKFYKNFCQMDVIHDRMSDGMRVVWIAEKGRETELIFVLMNGGTKFNQSETNYSHFGIALESRKAVDQIAERAKKDKILFWPAIDEPYPVGYYCGVRDPNGTIIEFSYGQPLGPGALQK